MIVLCDTSIITNLIQLNEIELLHQLFGVIIISTEVSRELAKREENKAVISQLDWLEIKAPSNQKMVILLREILDFGESESIVLAIELEADLLLMDERKGRKIAQSYNLRIMGLLGVLILAKQEQLIPNVKPLLARLNELGFRISDELNTHVLNICGE